MNAEAVPGAYRTMSSTASHLYHTTKYTYSTKNIFYIILPGHEKKYYIR